MSELASRAAFVNRRAELGVLLSRLDRLRQGSGSLVLVSGPVGIGKRRLIDEFARLASEAGTRVRPARAYPTDGGPQYSPFLAVLRMLLRDGVPLEIVQSLPSKGSYLHEILPELPVRATRPSDAPSDGGSAEYLLFDEVSELLFEVAHRAADPLVVILQDLHLADDASLRLLRHLTRRMQENSARLLIVGSYHDGALLRRASIVDGVSPLADIVNENAGAEWFSQIAVPRLSKNHVAELIRSVVGKEGSERVVDELYPLTDGNPWLVVTFAGDVRARMKGFRARPFEDLSTSFRSAVRMRLLSTSRNARQLANVAAVLGDPFSFDTLAATTRSAWRSLLPGPSAVSIDEPALIDALEELISFDILHEGGNGYSFCHALVRDAIYADLNATRRNILHHHAAKVIEDLYGADLDEHIEVLLSHCRKSGHADDSLKVPAYARRAALRAASVYAWVDAANSWQIVIDALAADPAETPPPRLEALLGMAAALLAAGEPQRVVRVVAPEAFNLAVRSDLPDQAAKVCQLALIALRSYGSGRIVTSTEYGEWTARANQYAHGSAAKVYADLAYAEGLIPGSSAIHSSYVAALHQAHLLGDHEAVAVAATALLSAPGAPQFWSERLPLVQAFEDFSGEDVQRSTLGALIAKRADVLRDAGDRVSALKLSRQVADLATRTRDAGLLLRARTSDVIAALFDGNLEEVIRLGETLIAESDALGAPLFGRSWASTLTFRANLYLGRQSDAMSVLEAAEELPDFVEPWWYPAVKALYFASAGDRAGYDRSIHTFRQGRDVTDENDQTDTWVLLELLEAATLAGDRPLAARLAVRLKSVAEWAQADLAFTCPARHLAAEAELRGDIPAAISHLRTAVAVCERSAFRPELALARLRLGQLLVQRGDQDGRTFLGRASRELTEMGLATAMMGADGGATRSRTEEARAGGTPPGGEADWPHSPLYDTITYQGRYWTLTTHEAQIVAELDAARLSHNPYRSLRELFELLGRNPSQQRARDLFSERNRALLGTLIAADRRRYYLNLSESTDLPT